MSKLQKKQPLRHVEILLHEILHGVAYHSKVFEDRKDAKDPEEITVDLMAKGLASIFNDNPDLLDHIKEVLDNGKE